MSIESGKPRGRKLAWIAAAVLLALAALAAAPFLATTLVARLTLAHLYPANNPSVGSVALSTSGTVMIRDLVLRDTGALAGEPLITAGEVDASFGWRDLLAGRKIARIRVADVRIYARSNASSQLSLLDLFFGRTTKPNRATLPMWVDAVEVDGIIHREPVAGFVAGTSDWPLKFRMTMSGDRINPSRRLSVSVGDEKHLADFGLSAEAEMQPTARGTRVVLRPASRTCRRRASWIYRVRCRDPRAASGFPATSRFQGFACGRLGNRTRSLVSRIFRVRLKSIPPSRSEPRPR